MEYGSGSAPPATPQRVARGDGPGHAHLKRPLVNPLKLRTDAAAYPNGPLCALVEICGDNPADAGATAVSIDVMPPVTRQQFDTGPRLRIVDDGCSMSAAQLHHAVSHGFTTRKKGRYGMYGYGLQVGAFCNGSALLIGCKTPDGVHVALLSLHYLDECAIQEVKIATVSWQRRRGGAGGALPADYVLQEALPHSAESFELSESLFVLRHFSPYDDKEALLAAVLGAVVTPTGTMQELFHLHTTADGAPLLRFDVDGDVLLRPGVSKTHTNLPAEQRPPALDTSLRAYLEVLYLQPRLRITLRGEPVRHRALLSDLWQLQQVAPYAPRSAEGARVLMTLGLAVEEEAEAGAAAGGADAADAACVQLSRRGGVALYWQGRLIRYCEPLGMQRSHGALAAGVCGVVDVGELLTPLPTKQGFEQDEHHARLFKELGERVNIYTNMLVETRVLDADLQRRRLTDAAAEVLASVRARGALAAAVAADARRALQCADCGKHRFVSDALPPAEFDALEAAAWRCGMHPDADAAAAGCDAPQEAPQQAPQAPGVRAEVPLPPWMAAYGAAAEGWRCVRVTRPESNLSNVAYNVYIAPSGAKVRGRNEVEFLLKGGAEGTYQHRVYSRRLTDAAPAAAASVRKRRGKPAVAAAEAEEDEEEDEAAAPAKRARARSTIQQLAVVQQEKEKGERLLAKKEKELQRERAALAAEKAAFERKTAAEARRREAGARRSTRFVPAAAAPPPAPSQRGGPRVCRCQRTVEECGTQLTIACDQCGIAFHAECLGMAHDVAGERGFTCADHADAAVAARLQAAALLPHPRTARRCAAAGRAEPAPSPSGSLFGPIPEGGGSCAGGGGEDDAATASDGLPANWPTSAGSPAFLTHNVHGAWPSPEAWTLLHTLHEQAPLPGVQIRTLPLTHKLAKAAIGAKGSKPRGLFATRGFPEGAVIGEYAGHVRHATSMDGASQYLLELSSVATPDGRKVLVDAGPCGNETRFINWHRGLARAPNCAFREARVLRGGGSCAELVVQVLAARRIERDEELLVDYGASYHLPGDAGADDEYEEDE